MRSAFAGHQSCDCGFGWYGNDADDCLWCAGREQFPELPRPVDIGIDARSPDSNVRTLTEGSTRE